MKRKTIGFIGGGRITSIFLHAFANKKMDFNSVIVCDPNKEKLLDLKKSYLKINITDNPEIAAKQDIIFIATHPTVIMDLLQKIAPNITTGTRIVSLAPKISIREISSVLQTRNIARMIPNASSYLNEGYNPVTYSPDFDAELCNELKDIFGLLGNAVEVEEAKLEAFAVVSAMLPTYFWFQWLELEKMGVEMGLTSEESKKAIRNSLIPAIHLMYDNDLSFEQVIDLIPVKPLAGFETEFINMYRSSLLSVFEKIKPKI